MSDETRATLLHGQLQEGLQYELMKAPAVSGSHTYRELCLAARKENKLAMRRQYRKTKSQYTNRGTPTFHDYGRVVQDRYTPALDRCYTQEHGSVPNHPRDHPRD